MPFSFSWQISHNKEIIFHHQGQTLDFNLGTVSSILDAGNVTSMCDLQFDIFMDISTYLDYSESLDNVEPIRNRTGATMTHFRVPTETRCFVSITTEYGEVNMHFQDGEIIEMTGDSVRNISSNKGHVFLKYQVEMRKVNFRCNCMNQSYNCSSTFMI